MELALPIQVRHAQMTREIRGRETADTQQREREREREREAREADVETDRWTKTERRSDGERRNKRKERGTLTRVCLYLRAFLSDASAAIDTLSLTQK